MTQRHIRKQSLPVWSIDKLEELNCWENIIFAYLCLDDEEFETIYNAIMNKNTSAEVNETEKMREEIKKEVAGDKKLLEIEKILEKGVEDINSIKELLDNW